MHNGQKATIVAYRTASDLDVRFEDGTEVCGVLYGNFKKGRVLNPSIQPFGPGRGNSLAPLRMGEERTMNCGLQATIVAYRGCMDVDVRFQNGILVPHRPYRHFCQGNILPEEA